MKKGDKYMKSQGRPIGRPAGLSSDVRQRSVGRPTKASLKRNKPKKMKKGDKYMTSQGEAASDEKCTGDTE